LHVYHGRHTNSGKIKDPSWDKKALTKYLESIGEFQKRSQIPSNRILVGEFGCYRKQKGLPKYFSDLVSIFNKNGWHWAFYAFREDSWDEIDYELDTKDYLGVTGNL
jgi:hypothetical protein